MDRAVDCLTRVRSLRDRLTAAERRALVAVGIAWAVGTVSGWSGWDARLSAWAQQRLDPPLPTAERLAARLPPGDPRPGWYAAGLALREELERARSGPAPIDPNRADRADWDRLPGIGPRTALAILAHRDSRGPFRGPEDLLAVRGIGPKKLARIAPWVRWSERGRSPRVGPDPPSLNSVDEEFLASLSGIGPQLASSIVRRRRERHGFRAWSEVEAIEGIGPTRLRTLQIATRIAGSRSSTIPNREREDR